MAENSKIEWCHHTDNLWWGCSHVHAGCDHCYAEVLSKRWGHDLWADGGRRMIKGAFNDLRKFQKQAAEKGEIHRVFIGSMMDIFEKSMPLINPWEHLKETDDLRQELFTQMTWGPNGEGLFPNLMFLFLTKRPSNIAKYIPAGWLDESPKNVMWGTSVSDQKTASTLIPQLLKIKGNKFLSIEPQLGPVDITQKWINYSVPTAYDGQGNGIEWTDPGDKFIGIDWVIQGGESGPHKRPFYLAWARSMRDQCKEARVPYFFKQIDKIQSIPEDLQIREFPRA